MPNNYDIELAYRRTHAGSPVPWMRRAKRVMEEADSPYSNNEDQVALVMYRMIGWPAYISYPGPSNAILIQEGIDEGKDFTEQMMAAGVRTLKQEYGNPPPEKDEIKNITGRPGSEWKLNELNARAIGFSNLWFPWSRLSSCTDAEALSHVNDKYQEGCNTVLYALSTWHRPEMNEKPFHALENKQQVLDRAGLFEKTGHSIVLEACTWEYAFGHKNNSNDPGFLGSDPDRIYDYLQEIRELINKIPNCKLAFPYREMDLAWRDKRFFKPEGDRPYQIKVRMTRYKTSLQCLVGRTHEIGCHTSPHWIPPRSMIVPGMYFMAQTRFDLDAEDTFTWEDDDHKKQTTTNAEFMRYWGMNRFNHRMIAAEHSINKLDQPNDWSPEVQTVERALRVGRHHLETQQTLIDLSGGANR